MLRRVGAGAAKPGPGRGRSASSQPTASSSRRLGGDGGGRRVTAELSAARPFGGAGPTRPDHGVPASAPSSALEERDTEAAQPGERGRRGLAAPRGEAGPRVEVVPGVPPVPWPGGPPASSRPCTNPPARRAPRAAATVGALPLRCRVRGVAQARGPQEEPGTGAGCRPHRVRSLPEARYPPGINRFSAHMWVEAACLPWAGEELRFVGLGAEGLVCVPPGLAEGARWHRPCCGLGAAVTLSRLPVWGHPSVLRGSRRPRDPAAVGRGWVRGPREPVIFSGWGRGASCCSQTGIAFLFPSQISRRPDPAVPRRQPPAPHPGSRWPEQQKPL